MVLEILPDARQMLDYGNPEATEFGLIADTGLHQYLRRVDGAERQDDFVTRANTMISAVVENLDSRNPQMLKGQPRHQRVCENRQIRLVHHREGIGTENRLAFPGAG